MAIYAPETRCRALVYGATLSATLLLREVQYSRRVWCYASFPFGGHTSSMDAFSAGSYPPHALHVCYEMLGHGIDVGYAGYVLRDVSTCEGILCRSYEMSAMDLTTCCYQVYQWSRFLRTSCPGAVPRSAMLLGV
eukprot:3941928-Rhodomonas_salina.6